MKEFIDFVHGVQIATKALQLYSSDHPRSAEALRNLATVTDALLGFGDRAQVVTSHGRIFVNGKPVEEKGPAVAALCRQLAEREVNGFVLYRGVTPRELGVLARLLNLKPQKIDEVGGVQQYLHDAQVSNIRVSHVRYEELTESEKIVDSTRLAELTAIAGTSSLNLDPTQLTALIATAFSPLLDASGRAPRAGGGAPALEDDLTMDVTGADLDPRRLSPLDLTTIQEKLDAAGALELPDFQEIFAGTIGNLKPEAQSRLLLSRNTLPPGQLREILDNLAPVLVMNIVAALASRNSSTNGELPDMIQYLYSQIPAPDRSLEVLRDRLDSMGINRDEIEELMQIVTWEQLDIDTRLQRLMEGRRIFDLPSERLTRFLRDLLVQGRHDDFIKVIDRYGAGLTAETADQRRAVSESFVRIARWAKDPGFLPLEENTILRLLLRHFLHEPDKALQQSANDALSSFIGAWMSSRRADKATRALMNLEAAVSAVATQLPWKKQAYDSFLSQLARDHVGDVTTLLFELDHDALATDVLPALTFLGAPAASELIDRLAAEDDRGRRGRLIKAVKAIGLPALIPLRHALTSPTWYLVRNALNLLGDLAATDLVEEVGNSLRHTDGRVARTAARSLSKIGGPRAEALLIAAIPHADAEMLTEIMFSLGAMRAETAIDPIAEVARHRRIGTDEQVRERAIDALGQIGSARAVPALEEILRRKGILGSGETPEIRVAAARSLALINTAEARLAIKKAVESESGGPARDQLMKLLAEPVVPRESA